jgi:hypothetical protein
MKRLLSLNLNAPGYGAAAGAVYAAVVMIVHATHHHGVIDPQVIVAAVGGGYFLWTRFKVTPVADPKDGNGKPLVTAPVQLVMNMPTTTTGTFVEPHDPAQPPPAAPGTTTG